MRTLSLQTGVIVAALIFIAPICAAQTGSDAAYRANCAMCHGKTGAGEMPLGQVLKVKPFTDPTVVQMTDSALNETVMNGKGRMPAFATKLSADQISSLIQYIHQLQGK